MVEFYIKGRGEEFKRAPAPERPAPRAEQELDAEADKIAAIIASGGHPGTVPGYLSSRVIERLRAIPKSVGDISVREVDTGKAEKALTVIEADEFKEQMRAVLAYLVIGDSKKGGRVNARDIDDVYRLYPTPDSFRSQAIPDLKPLLESYEKKSNFDRAEMERAIGDLKNILYR